MASARKTLCACILSCHVNAASPDAMAADSIEVTPPITEMCVRVGDVAAAHSSASNAVDDATYFK